MMNLNRLNHLVALADECHFARAAARVHLSQPAFSRSIQAMERDTGMPLFDRGGGDIKPTPAGLFLIERARQLLFDARCMRRDIGLYRDSQLGDTAFGFGPLPSATLLTPLVLELRSRFPRVGVRLMRVNWQQGLGMLVNEEIEFFVAHTDDLVDKPRLDIQLLMHQYASFYVREGHPLGVGPHRLRDIWTYGVGTPVIPPAIQSLIANALGLPAGTTPSLALECDDFGMLHQTGRMSDTVVATTDIAVHMDGNPAGLRKLNVSDFPDVRVAFGIVSLRKRTPSPMARQVMDTLKRIAGTLQPVL